MSEEKKKDVATITETWSLIVDPKSPQKSLVLYKGEPLLGVTSVSLGIEPQPVGESGQLVVASVLTVKVLTTSLALGTYTAPTEPVQQELPLETKPG